MLSNQKMDVYAENDFDLEQFINVFQLKSIHNIMKTFGLRTMESMQILGAAYWLF